MNRLQNFKGEKYTLHIISYNDKHIIRWSDNQVNESIGTICLEEDDELTVDELVNLIKKDNKCLNS